MKIRSILVLAIIMLLSLTLLSCCTKPKNDTDTPLQSIELSEGVHLTNLFISRQGSMREPYCIISAASDGVYLKMTYTYPLDLDENSYFSFASTIGEDETAIVLKVDIEELKSIEDLIEKYGVLGWNGFNESQTLNGVLDADMHYSLFMTLSDGSTIDATGYNVYPRGMDDFFYDIFLFINARIPEDEENRIYF